MSQTVDPSKLATMSLADALVYADMVAADWPNGFSQLDRAAFVALKDEVRRLSDNINAVNFELAGNVLRAQRALDLLIGKLRSHPCDPVARETLLALAAECEQSMRRPSP
jgi:hypothetical protein